MRLVLPEAVWEALLDEFARQRAGVERVAYLDGYLGGGVAVVTTLTIPNATCEPGYYTVSSDQMRQAGAHFRPYAMARLAQVHTHVNEALDHSRRDDDMAYSQREGAISIVLPEHASRRPSPLSGLVHLRTADLWRPLNTDEAAALIVLVPSILDFRKDIWTASRADTKMTLRGAWRRLMQFTRSLSWWRSHQR